MDRCWCCGSLMDTKGDCPVCDSPGMVSPPHVCERNDTLLSDEHGCPPEVPELPLYREEAAS